MQLYAASFLAWRVVDGDYTLRISPGVILATSADDAVTRGMPAAIQAFPEADGWEDHEVIVAAVETPMDLEGYRLTWQIEAR